MECRSRNLITLVWTFYHSLSDYAWFDFLSPKLTQSRALVEKEHHVRPLKINYHSDIDECRFNSNNCSNNAICINTKGSFNCSCKPGYSGNGHDCSGGCLRSFIYLLRLANPCRVTVTAHTELLGPVTVPSLMRNRPPHSTWVLYRPKDFICARVVRWGQRLSVLIWED